MLSAVRHPWDVTERTTLFTGIPPHISILSGIEGIRSGKEDLRDDVVSKMIELLNVRKRLGGFNQSQIREIFQGF